MPIWSPLQRTKGQGARATAQEIRERCAAYAGRQLHPFGWMALTDCVGKFDL